jgi:hypothetical protein
MKKLDKAVLVILVISGNVPGWRNKETTTLALEGP